jgi:hypothetical protein
MITWAPEYNNRQLGDCCKQFSVLLHLDDILIVSDSLKWIKSAKRAIVERFRMTDFGEA